MERAFLEQGNYEFGQGKYRAAIKSYGQAIALDSQLVEAYYKCGLAAEKLGREQLAYKCLATVIKLEARPSPDLVLRASIIEKSISDKIRRNTSQSQFSLPISLLISLLGLILYINAPVIADFLGKRHIIFHGQPQNNSETVPNSVEQKSDESKVSVHFSAKYLANDPKDYSQLLAKIEGLKWLEHSYEIDKIKVDENAEIGYSTGEKIKAIAISLDLSAKTYSIAHNRELDLHYYDRDGNEIEQSFVFNYVDYFNLSFLAETNQATIFIPQNPAIAKVVIAPNSF